MGLTVERVMFFMALSVLCVASMAEVYKVGDDKGWTTVDIPDYKKWAASKAFKIGDSVVFEYAPAMHNVLQVTYANYKSCNSTSPIRTFTSGKDTIPIKTNGHFFYICGIANHCQLGQRVDVRVVSHVTPTPPSAPAPSSSTPAPSAPAPPPSSVSAPAPSPSSAVTLSKGLTGKFAFVILAVVAAVAY